jgi:predicted transcriptional regulator
MTFRMPVALIGRLDRLAERVGWNRTQVIVALLQDGLDTIENREPGNGKAT